jgi:hypothetical protein
VWAKLRALLDDPSFWARTHATLTVIWVLLIPPSILLWRDSVPYLVLISVWANVAGSAASWQAAKADRNSVDADDLRRVEAKVDALVGKVNLLMARGR